MERREFLKVVEEQIRTRRVRPVIVEEMENHIEDQKRAFMAEGMTESEAEEEAVRQMGDPVEAGVALDRIHRPRMEWSVLTGVLLISILGLFLQNAVILAANPSGASWNDVFAGAGIGKHLMFILIGTLLMLVICWIDYSYIYKHAITLWILVNVFLIFCMMKSPLINGRPYYLTHVSYLLIPLYAGVLYHFRGQAFNGLLKSVLCLGVPLAILSFYYMISNIFIIGMVALILIHAAIWRKWFGDERKALYLKLWGVLILILLAVFGIFILWFGGRILAEYQIARLDVWLHPGNGEGMNAFIKAVAEAGEEVRKGSSYLALNMLSEIRSSYLWIFLFRYLGVKRGILLTVFVLGFCLFLFSVVRRQKNQFGYMVSLGCALFLSIQTILYMGMNFSIIPLGAAYMPFISSGGAFLLISYFYMGILLSVCNNSKAVRNS